LLQTIAFKEACMAESTAPNVALDLLRIHAIITRGLTVATEKSQVFAQAGPPDASTLAGFTCYARSLASVLHGHHLTEDELAFPYLRTKVPDAPYDLLTAQHQELAALVDQTRTAIDDVEAGRDVAASLTRLNGVLRRAIEVWQPHIGIEEDRFAPDKVGPLLAREEHVRLGGLYAAHGRRHMGPAALVVPFLLYNLPREERALFARNMPFVLTRLLVPVVWKNRWAPMRPFLLP
jgi:hemerythrin-like domain-containing protein